MAFQLVAVHYRDKTLKEPIAFRIVDTKTMQIVDRSYDIVKSIVASNKANIVGIEYDRENDKLRGDNGTFSRYTSAVNNIMIKLVYVIIATIDDVGYRLYSPKNNSTKDFYTDELINGIGENLANGKIVKRDGAKPYISAISGQFENIAFNDSGLYKGELLKKEGKAYAEEIAKNVNNKNTLIGNSNIRVIPNVQVDKSKLKDIDEDTGMSVEQKLTIAGMQVGFLRPFYDAIFSMVDKVESGPKQGIDTMGVTLTKMYFNPDYVKEKTLMELIFVLFHEICHLAMKHRARENRRNHALWNIATDLYINKHLKEEFGLNGLGDIKSVHSEIKNEDYKVAMPLDILFCDAVDLEKDTPEGIYEELFRENPLDIDITQGEGESQENNGDKEQGKEQGKGQGKGQGKDRDNNKNQSNSKGSDGSGGSGGSKEQNCKDNKDNTQEDGDNKCQASSGLDGKTIRVKFRGSTYTARMSEDLVEGSEEQGKSKEQIQQESDILLRKAMTIYKQSQHYGSGGGRLERLVEKVLAPKINWRTLVRNFLIKESETENSFAHPDRRFLSRYNSDGSRQVFAGPYAAENGRLGAIKICIDTSGSIGDTELAIALAQTKDLLKQYKADAELIYWDAEVQAIYPLDDVKDLLKKKPVGGGGTDVNVVFKHFDTAKEYKIRKKEPPSLILIFTDGYFGPVNSKYAKYRNTIWIINNNDDFKAPFGVAANFVYE